MHAREDSHRHVPRIIADEHLVNFENRAQLSIESFGGNVCEIEKDLILTADAHPFDAHLKDLAGGDIARNKIAVSWILLFEEVETFTLRNRRRRTNVTLLAGHPNAPAFTTRRFGHQSQLV